MIKLNIQLSWYKGWSALICEESDDQTDQTAQLCNTSARYIQSYYIDQLLVICMIGCSIKNIVGRDKYSISSFGFSYYSHFAASILHFCEIIFVYYWYRLPDTDTDCQMCCSSLSSTLLRILLDQHSSFYSSCTKFITWLDEALFLWSQSHVSSLLCVIKHQTLSPVITFQSILWIVT